MSWVENAVRFLYDFLHLATGKRSLPSAIYVITVLAIVWLASSHGDFVHRHDARQTDDLDTVGVLYS